VLDVNDQPLLESSENCVKPFESVVESLFCGNWIRPPLESSDPFSHQRRNEPHLLPLLTVGEIHLCQSVEIPPPPPFVPGVCGIGVFPPYLFANLVNPSDPKD